MAPSVSYYYADHLGSILEAQDELHEERNGAQSVPLLLRAWVEQLLTIIPPPPYDAQPPGYEDSVEDLPPEYTCTDVLATSSFSKSPLHIHRTVPTIQTYIYPPSWLEKSDRVDIDLKTPHNVRSHANKKAKQAAKAASKSKWADSGDEAEGSKGGGEGGSANDGDGGSAGGGGGGDEGGGGGDDFWDEPGKKSKKPKKKGKKDDEEDEEKKTDGPAADADNFWDNLDSGEKAGDAVLEDEWATGASSKKKGKKGKKGDDVPPPPPVVPDAPTAGLDFSAPQLDLSFGGNETKATNDYSFGGWGGGSSGWGFSGTGDKKDATAAADTGTDSWGLGSGKKDKKKKSAGFDFGFAATEDIAGEEPLVETKKDDDAWGGFTATTNKKDKKSKKSIEEPIVEVPPPPPPIEKVPEDSWANLSTPAGKKDTKSKKSVGFGALDATPEDPVADVVVVPEAPPADDDSWGMFGSKKDKKGKKGTAAKDPEPTPPPPPPVVPEPPIDDFWSNTAEKKSTKKGKKGEEKSPPKVEEPAIVVVPEAEPAGNEDSWGMLDTGKKDKKGKKNAKADPGPVVVVPEPEPPKDDPWSFGSTTTKGKKDVKKDAKKSNAGAFSATDDLLMDDDLAVVAMPAMPEEPAWSAWGADSKTADKKKSKKGAAVEPTPPLPPPEPIKEVKDDDLGSSSIWGVSKKDKEKDKKGKKGELDAKPDKKAEKSPSPPPEVNILDEDPWGSWGGTKKDKKGKKGAMDVMPPAPTPPNLGLTPGSSPTASQNNMDANMDELMFDDWTSPTATKSKKKDDKKDSKKADLTSTTKDVKSPGSKLDKKGIKDAPKENDYFAGLDEPLPDEAPKEEPAAKTTKGFWGAFGGSTSTTKTKKELDKEKKDKEEKEAKEMREADAKAKKEKEEAELAEKEKVSKKKGLLSSGKITDSKTDSKINKKSKDDDLAWPAASPVDEKPPSPEAEKPKTKKSDAWSFWGASTLAKDEKPEKEEVKKTAGKSGKEIGNEKLANHKDTFSGTSDIKATKESTLKTPTTAASAGKDKTTADPASPPDKKSKPSVADKIKAFQSDQPSKKEKEASGTSFPTTVTSSAAPLSETDPKTATSTSKASSKDKDLKRKKDLSADPVSKITKAHSPVPGGFPGDDFNDDFDLGKAAAPAKKSDKVTKKAEKRVKESDFDSFEIPPPPPPAKEEKTKKSSLSPPRKPEPELKKSSSSKVKEPIKLPTPPPELVEPKPNLSKKKDRSRTTRDEAAPSSWGNWGASVDPPVQHTDHRERRSSIMREDSPPKKSRSAAPGLSRSKSERKPRDWGNEPTSRSGSDEVRKTEARPKPTRGLSISSLFGKDVGAKPPSKRRDSVAELSKTSRRRSVAVDAGLPSPPPEEQVNDKAAKFFGLGRRDSKMSQSPSTREKPKKRSVPDPYALPSDDDLIVVDDALGEGPQEPATKRKSRKSRRDDDAVMVDNHGPYSGPEIVNGPDDLAFVEQRERPRVRRAESSARKTDGLIAGLFGGLTKEKKHSDDDNKRVRRESRRVDQDRGSPGASRDQGLDGADARRAERRARKAEDEKAVRSKKDRKSRLVKDDDPHDSSYDRERAERRAARKAAKEAEQGAACATPEDIEAQDAARRDRRSSMRDPQDLPSKRDRDRPTTTRQHSHNPYPEDEEYVRRPDRASKSKTSRKKSTLLGDEYIKSRSPDKKARPDLNRSGTDKTASWVQRVNVEPPLPPPVEGTIIEPVPEEGATTYQPRSVDKERRKEPRKSEYRKERERERERRANRIVDDDPGSPADEGTPLSFRELEQLERPGMQNKRQSWFGKLGF